MEQLARLAKFQEADILYDNCEAELRNSPTYKRYMKVRVYLEEQKRIINRMTSMVETRNKMIEQTTSNIDLLNGKFVDATQKYESLDKTDLSEVERFRKFFEQLNQLLATERREFAEITTSIEKDDALLSDMRTKLGKARKEYDELREKLEGERKEKAEIFAQLKLAAEEASKDIEEKLLTDYKRIKKSHPNPLSIVTETRCGGCAMEISAVTLRNIKEGTQILECDNCGRILFYNAPQEEPAK